MNNHRIDSNQKDLHINPIQGILHERILLILLGILTLPSFIIALTFLVGSTIIISLLPGILSPSLTGFVIGYFIIGFGLGLGLYCFLLNIIITLPIIYLILIRHDYRGVRWLRILAFINLFNPIHGTLVSIVLLIILTKFYIPAPKVPIPRPSLRSISKIVIVVILLFIFALIWAKIIVSLDI